MVMTSPGGPRKINSASSLCICLGHATLLGRFCIFQTLMYIRAFAVHELLFYYCSCDKYRDFLYLK